MTTHTANHTAPTMPGPAMLHWVMGGFVRQGTTLTEWCRDHGESRVHARVALLGERNGPKAQALRTRLLEAAHGR